MNDQPRRAKILRITDSLLVQMLGEGNVLSHRVVKDGLPPDARVLDVKYDAFGPGVFVLLIESGEFEPVAVGGPYPEIEPRLETITHE